MVILKCRHIKSLRPVTSLLAPPQPTPQNSLTSPKSEKSVGHDCGWIGKEQNTRVSSCPHLRTDSSQSELYLWYTLKDWIGEYLEPDIRLPSVGAMVLCAVWVLTVQEPEELKAQ